MKGANFLEKLLDNQPVEWKKLGEVADYIRGVTYNKQAETQEEDSWVVLRANNIDISSRQLCFDELKRVVRSTKVTPKQHLQIGDILICAGSGSKEHIGKTAYIAEQLDYTFGGFMGVVRCSTKLILPRFLFHYIGGNNFKRYLSVSLKSSTINNLNSSIMNSFPLPIPPLSVQERIVEILDKFTSLEAELEAELDCRKRQYIYYRERLFDFSQNNHIQWKKLGELAELVRGNGLSKKDFAPAGIPAIHYGQIYTYYGNETKETISFVTPETASKLRKVYCGNVVITNTSENLEDVGKALLYTGKSEAVTGGHATIIRCSEHLLPKYFVYYTMTYSFFDQKRKLAKGTKVIDVSATDLARIEIPLPPLSEQARIVEILDKFDTLTNSISEGLPLEIQLRRQQYEYYREQLLDFRR